MEKESKKRDRFLRIRVGRKALVWTLAGVFACVAVYKVLSTTLTVSAYYPSPYGAYTQLLTIWDTTLARNRGTVYIGGNGKQYNNKPTDPQQNVLLIYGNAAMVPGSSGKPGTFDAQGSVKLPLTSQVPSCTDGMVAINNTPTPPATTPCVSVCENGSWTDCSSGGGGLAQLPSGMQFNYVPPKGAPTNCPTGSTPIMYFYPTTTCGSSSPYPCSCTTGGWTNASSTGKPVPPSCSISPDVITTSCSTCCSKYGCYTCCSSADMCAAYDGSSCNAPNKYSQVKCQQN